MASEKFHGWDNKLTWVVAHAIGEWSYYDELIYGWVDECEESGMSKSDAMSYVAQRLRDLVETDCEDALDALREIPSPIICRILGSLDLHEINYADIADGYLDDYAPKNKSGSKPTVSQNAKRKPAASKAAKPRAATNKRPAQSKAAPKKAGTVRRR